MADAYWMQLGGNPCFALEVGGQVVGVTYWVDPEPIGRGPSEQSPTPAESGWYFVAVTHPRDPERVARGLELKQDMSHEEMAQSAQSALEVVAHAVLAEGGDD